MLPFIDGIMIVVNKVGVMNSGRRVRCEKTSERESDGGGRPCFGRRQARPGSGFFSCAGGSVASQEPKRSDEASSHSTVLLYVVFASDLYTLISSDLVVHLFIHVLSCEAHLNRKIALVLMRFMARVRALTNFRPLAASANGSPRTGQATHALGATSRVKSRPNMIPGAPSQARTCFSYSGCSCCVGALSLTPRFGEAVNLRGSTLSASASVLGSSTKHECTTARKTFNPRLYRTKKATMIQTVLSTAISVIASLYAAT